MMKNRLFIVPLVVASLSIALTASAQKIKVSEIRSAMVDRLATDETVAMYYNLKQISGKKIIFGQQDATASGYGWYNNSGKCDIKDICGSYPAFYSWDFMDFTRPDSVNLPAENKIRRLTIEAYNRGGINSYCWHFWHPITNKSFYDTTRAVKYLLPGG